MPSPSAAPPPALLLIGHGSRDAAGVAEFHRLAERLYARLPERQRLTSFLELTEPLLPRGLETLVRQGAVAITALPVMLLAAGHIKNDIPYALRTFQAARPGVRITLGTELGVHPAMLAAARERIEAGEAAFGPAYSRRETLLLIVGRGSSDPDANSNLSVIARLLWESMGFGWAETAYCAVTPPTVGVALERGRRLGYRRIIVFPYVLFTGRVIDRIHAAVGMWQAAQPDAQAVIAPYLNDHPGVVQTLLERLAQAESGQALMNCRLCQYREPIIGYERRWRLPQAPDHL